MAVSPMASFSLFRIGVVTLLFTDIEGATRLLRQAGPRYYALIDEYGPLMRNSFLIP